MKGSSKLFAYGPEYVTGNISFMPKNDKKSSLKNSKGIYIFKSNIYPHKIPIKHIPNSIIEQKNDDGKVVRRRYYDENGNAYKDIDYTDHGFPKTHKVPHVHIIEIGNEIERKKGE